MAFKEKRRVLSATVPLTIIAVALFAIVVMTAWKVDITLAAITALTSLVYLRAVRLRYMVFSPLLVSVGAIIMCIMAFVLTPMGRFKYWPDGGWIIFVASVFIFLHSWYSCFFSSSTEEDYGADRKANERARASRRTAGTKPRPKPTYPTSTPRSTAPSSSKKGTTFHNVSGPTKVLPNGSRVYGVAGSNIASNEKFGADLVAAGAAGERRLGRLLEDFASKHECVIFHGLQFGPGTDGADVDHALLIGGNLVLIDAKNWKAGSYGVRKTDFEPEVMRDTGEGWGPFLGGKVKMYKSRNEWDEYLRGRGTLYQVDAYIVMTGNPANYQVGSEDGRFTNVDAYGTVLHTLGTFPDHLQAYWNCYYDERSNGVLEAAIARCCQTLDVKSDW